MSKRRLRTRAVVRTLAVGLLLAAIAVVPTAAASGSAKPRHRPYRADGWIRVYPKAHHKHATKKKRQTKSGSTRTESVSAYGIAAGGNLHNLGADELARELDVYRAAGSGWIRIDINWEVIQAGGPSSYNWAPFDRVVQAARDRGLQILATILYTPAWARPGTSAGTYPPADLGTYGAFAATAVARYAPLGVHAWEIWNEPNRNFWKPSADPARYTDLLKLAYAAIKRADPQASVVSGGLSPYGAVGETRADGMNPVTFLQKMYAAGAAGHFDAVGWHPYEWGVGVRFHPMSAWSQLTETSTNVRSVMAANGDGSKPVWGTEYGAPTFSGGISEAAQAELLQRAYREWSGWRWAGPLFWYSARDAGTDPGDREDHFGLVRRDFAPKGSFAAYQAVARG
jgi:polysaccharide biosynthesis protein PslG